MVQVNKWQILRLVNENEGAAAFIKFGTKKRNSEMVKQASQLETQARRLDKALVTLVLCTVGCVAMDGPTRYYFFSIATACSVVSLYAVKKIYDSACYFQEALNRYPELIQQIKWRSL